ncbi:MAG: Geranylgeranyl diphosphate synthase, partial [uncultured Phycisphaerae bacterium]
GYAARHAAAAGPAPEAAQAAGQRPADPGRARPGRPARPGVRGGRQPRPADADGGAEGPRRPARRVQRPRPGLPRLRRHPDQQHRLAGAAGHRPVRAAAAADAQVHAGREAVPGPVRRVRPAVQEVRPLLHPGFAGRGRAARVRRAGGRGQRAGHVDHPDRQDRGDRRRLLPVRAGEGVPVHGVGRHPGHRDPAAPGRLRRHERGHGLGVGGHPPDQRRQDPPPRPRRDPRGGRRVVHAGQPDRHPRQEPRRDGRHRPPVAGQGRQAVAAVPDRLRVQGAPRGRQRGPDPGRPAEGRGGRRVLPQGVADPRRHRGRGRDPLRHGHAPRDARRAGRAERRRLPARRGVPADRRVRRRPAGQGRDAPCGRPRPPHAVARAGG